ncbi:hypothetical protein EI94DRAFT_1245161 [Lactarius quietus]|nr:hypothetical protein EI94DRAFT_1245161 [Lactarius quietus]
MVVAEEIGLSYINIARLRSFKTTKRSRASDGAALVRFFAWLEEQLHRDVGLSESQGADQLEKLCPRNYQDGTTDVTRAFYSARQQMGNAELLCVTYAPGLVPRGMVGRSSKVALNICVRTSLWRDGLRVLSIYRLFSAKDGPEGSKLQFRNRLTIRPGSLNKLTVRS